MIYVESPRDAFQSFKEFIPTELKIEYYNKLLKVGFDVIDIGSFVSPKAVPQMADTSEVIRKLDFTDTDTRLLTIIGNVRGTETLIKHSEISFAGYPYSVSEEFLKRNLRTDSKKSLGALKEIKSILDDNDKELVVYLSMGFGNPYDEAWNISLIKERISQLVELGIRKINISDTMGFSTKYSVNSVFLNIVDEYPEVEFGFHLHCVSGVYVERVFEAYRLGIRWFDSTINGLGGCPFTGYKEVGNLSTDNLIDLLGKNNIDMERYLDAKNFMIENILKYK